MNVSVVRLAAVQTIIAKLVIFHKIANTFNL
jgi:hypothetical protein